MTIIDDHHLVEWPAAPRRSGQGGQVTRRPRPARPVSTRPRTAQLRYQGTGVRVSRAPHPARSDRTVSTPVTVGLAALAALITVWLGLIANLSAQDPASTASVAGPERLAVVQVQAGETLQQLASRVAPDAPATEVVGRIRDLNALDSSAVSAGQTLIAPIG